MTLQDPAQPAAPGALPSEAEALDAYSRVVSHVAETLAPSVANLRVARRGGGSGVVITPDGFMLTSAHVVESRRGRPAIRAAFTDGREVGARVVGTDPLSDLAVLRADGEGLPPAELDDATTLRVGQLVVAIGNPLGFSGSVSAGVVSALGRSLPTQSGNHVRLVENVIQTDAALHPGNSGGALADSSARVVGVSTAVVGPGIGQGLGLAVPIDATTRRIIGALMAEGRVRRAFLGIAGGPRPLPPRCVRATGRERGVEVIEVVAGSPADRGGIRKEDIILDVDGEPVADGGDLQRMMTGDAVDRRLALSVWRDGGLMAIAVVPEELR